MDQMLVRLRQRDQLAQPEPIVDAMIERIREREAAGIQ